jgi:hypothetical protein
MHRHDSKIEKEIIQDFIELGFMAKENDDTLRITYLLWNFLYEEPVNFIY